MNKELDSSLNDLVISESVNEKEFKKFLLSLEQNTQSTFNHFGEINSNTVDSIIKKELERKDKEKFFGFLNDELIGYGFLTRFDKITKKQNCVLGIVIGDRWQNKGYGKKICQHMINFAWANGFTKVWLAVYLDNKSGINLYKSIGFQVEGIFMNDEKVAGMDRHVISMAIFNDRKNYTKERLAIWQDIEND